MHSLVRHTTTVDFIHICRYEKGDARFQKFSRRVGFNPKRLTKYRSQIETIMDFISYVDSNHHKNDPRDKTLLNATLHTHLSSDLRSLIILALTHQNYQLNIILRHFIEIFLVAIWADIISNYRGTFDYLLFTEKWKAHRKDLKMTWQLNDKLPNRSLKERLERIRLLNMIKAEGVVFYKQYLKKATDTDLLNLFSLPICPNCYSRKKDGGMGIIKFPLPKALRIRGKEAYRAKFRTDFAYTCCFCNKQKLTAAYALGIPEVSEMVDMLKATMDNRFVQHIDLLWKIYDYLSREYVHFAFFILPDSKAPEYDFSNGKKATLWGLDSVLFTINALKSLMTEYFRKQSLKRR